MKIRAKTSILFLFWVVAVSLPEAHARPERKLVHRRWTAAFRLGYYAYQETPVWADFGQYSPSIEAGWNGRVFSRFILNLRGSFSFFPFLNSSSFSSPEFYQFEGIVSFPLKRTKKFALFGDGGGMAFGMIVPGGGFGMDPSAGFRVGLHIRFLMASRPMTLALRYSPLQESLTSFQMNNYLATVEGKYQFRSLRKFAQFLNFSMTDAQYGDSAHTLSWFSFLIGTGVDF